MSDSFDEALEKGIELFNEQKFFEAYEVFEAQWNVEEDDGADLLQGLLQLSVGCSKFETGQFRGAIKLFELALKKIEIYSPAAYDMDIDALLVFVKEWLTVASKLDEMGVEGVKVKHVKTGEITNIPAKGVFVAIGHAPSNELVKDTLETHMGGYVVTKPDSTETSIPGVFAAGDLTDHKYRQAVTSAGMGCMAALEAERFLAEVGDDEGKDTSLPLGYGAEVKEDV